MSLIAFLNGSTCDRIGHRWSAWFRWGPNGGSVSRSCARCTKVQTLRRAGGEVVVTEEARR